MNAYMGLGTALLVAWLALRLALGSAALAVHVVGIVGVVILALGLRRRATRPARDAAGGAPRDGPAASRATRVVRLRPHARARTRRHG